MCDYCRFGRPSPDGENILCEKKGIKEKGEKCRAYKYDPLKRVPLNQPALADVDPSDFELLQQRICVRKTAHTKLPRLHGAPYGRRPGCNRLVRRHKRKEP